MTRGSLTAELSKRAFRQGIPSADALMLAVAIVVAWNDQREQTDGQALFQKLATQLRPNGVEDGLSAAQDWLNDPGLTSLEWQFVNDGLRFLKHEAAGPIVWGSEVEHCISPDHRYGIPILSLTLAHSIVGLLDFSVEGTFACMYSSASSIAWVLSEERDVTLYADQNVAVIMALLARAACRPLNVRRDNPLDGSFMPGSYVRDMSGSELPCERFDHIVSCPPLGARMENGPSKGMPFESYQIEGLVGRATKSFSALIPDGVLFRETKSETELRRELVSRWRTTVMSLPHGMYWPAASVSMSLLRLETDVPKTVQLVDGRSMDKTSSGRVQEGLVVQHFEHFRSLRSEEPERLAIVTVEQLSDNSFSLLPDRYLKSANLTALEKALEQRPSVTLSDIAMIERGKAPLPLREFDNDPPISALEVAPADLEDGFVREPTRKQAFGLNEQARVKGVKVQLGDILVSIKGNVGNVAMVDDLGVLLAEQLNEPWIVSQSLAIIRWKPNPYVLSPAILNALLTAPWVREKLESMSGATTVRTLPMSALRALAIPVPTAEDSVLAAKALEELKALRKQISEQRRNLAERQRQIWADLWQVPEEIGDD